MNKCSLVLFDMALNLLFRSLTKHTLRPLSKHLPKTAICDNVYVRVSSQSLSPMHRWKHHRPHCVPVPHLDVTANRYSQCTLATFTPTISITQNARLFSHSQSFGQEKSNDLDIAHIEKELGVETKSSTKRHHRSGSTAQKPIVSVGKFVPDKILELLDVDGTSLGKVDRGQAIALSQRKKLKLVLLKPGAKPLPVYKLMTGQELHEEQMKQNETAKKKAAPTQRKEIKASWNIGEHDIAVRRRQLESWFSNGQHNIHARVTVSGGRGTEVIAQEKQLAVVHKLLEGLEDRLTLNGPPQMMGRNMGTMKVTIRTMSAKEKTAYKKTQQETGQPAQAE